MPTTGIVPIPPANPVPRTSLWNTMCSLVLDGISSAHTRRAYEQALEEFQIWLSSDHSLSFNKASVQRYRRELQAKGLAPSGVNVRISALRKLAAEAGDNGLLAPEVAAGIGRVKGVRRAGVRLGHWLTHEEAERLLAAPDSSGPKGARDAALLSTLFGAGLRRCEVVALTFEHLQRRDGRWVIADLVGKHGRIRTVPIPDWVEGRIRHWAQISGVKQGNIFRGVSKSGRIRSQALSAQAVFSIPRRYSAGLGILYLRTTSGERMHISRVAAK